MRSTVFSLALAALGITGITWPVQAAVSECADAVVVLTITTDAYGYETSWVLRDGVDEVVASGQGFQDATEYVEELCLAEGTYALTVEDSFGDGLCCGYGEGWYSLAANGRILAEGAEFGELETTSFSLGDGPLPGPGGTPVGWDAYYAEAEGLDGFALKTALHRIIRSHDVRGYRALWSFYRDHAADVYYEQNETILDIYSEVPGGPDPYTFTATRDQCGNYRVEGDCYNREHAFPRSWFGGGVEPMNSDVHHIFPTDGKVNSERGSFPFGEVGAAEFISRNGSRRGPGRAGLGYSGTVFEPVDEFKGDLARAYFYMATRYEDRIADWERHSSAADAVLDGSSDRVFEPWGLELLRRWHEEDPVSPKERDRNDAAHDYQGNRNPFVDHPEMVELIWGR